MYNIKIYDRNNAFLTTLSEKQISCDFSFSATVGSGFSSLKFEYFWEYVINHRDIIKIYKEGNLIYQWFVIGISFISDRSWEKQIITLAWMLGLLSFKLHDSWTFNNDPAKLLTNIFELFTVDKNWEDLSLFDTSWIKAYGQSISLQANNLSCLEFLQEILKATSDYAFFIDENNKVWYTPYEEEEHILTYWENVYSITINEESSDYNKITLKSSVGTVTKQDNDWIAKYWESTLYLEETDIKNLTTASLRAQSLLREKAIGVSYKVLVNEKYDYHCIKPGQLVSIRNSTQEIETKKVKQITYNKDTASLTLAAYKSLEQVIQNA